MDMLDGIFVLLTLAFFAFTAGLVVFSDYLMRS